MFVARRPLLALSWIAAVAVAGSAAQARADGSVRPRPRTPLVAPIADALACDAHAVRRYLDEGGDPDATGAVDDGQPKIPLLVAAAVNGCPTVLSLLLDRGAHIEKSAPDGDTALLMVARHLYRTGTWPLVLLLRRGADPNHTFPKGTSALMWAVCPASIEAEEASIEAVRALVAHGADRDARNRDGESVTSRAERCGTARIRAALAAARQLTPPRPRPRPR